MIKKITVAALLAATSFAASAAQGNFYAGADIGSSKFKGYSSDTSVGVFGGYNFNQNVAVELGYRDLGDFGGSVKQTAVSVIGSVPVANKVAVYGRLGFNRLSGDGEHVNRGLFGAGVSYEFTKQFTGRVELQRQYNNAHNLSVGVAYNF
jgi:OOP family OmpA-OmpF porin